MTLVEMREDGIARAWRRALARGGAVLRDEHRDARALRLVVLFGDVQDARANHVRDLGDDVREALGVVLLIDVFDVILLLPRRFRVADVVNIEAQCFRQIIEAVQLQFLLQSS